MATLLDTHGHVILLPSTESQDSLGQTKATTSSPLPGYERNGGQTRKRNTGCTGEVAANNPSLNLRDLLLEEGKEMVSREISEKKTHLR